MFKNNIYNIDREFDYTTVKSIVLKSLQNIAKEEALKNASNICDNVSFDSKGIDGHNNVELSAQLFEHFINSLE
jgi:hypothetical protein